VDRLDRALRRPARGENFVPGALESSGEFGASAIFPEWNASARLRYLGPHALIEDNSQRGDPTLLVNLRAAWTPAEHARVGVLRRAAQRVRQRGRRHRLLLRDAFPGEPPRGRGLNSRIVEPRQVRVGVKFTF
jgi:hypothetical protein